MNETLEAIGDAVSVYKESMGINSTIAMNVVVIQGTRHEDWRFSGSSWTLEAINGLAVTATPFPTPLPYDMNPPPQSRPSSSSSSSNNSSSSGNTTRRPENCDDAVAMGLSAEEAAQWSHLDRDNDGVACYGD